MKSKCRNLNVIISVRKWVSSNGRSLRDDFVVSARVSALPTSLDVSVDITACRRARNRALICSWSSPAQSLLVSGLVGTHDHDIVPCRRYLLGYRIHHSVCYTVLFTTPRVVITIFLYTEFWPPDVSSRGGLLMSSLSVGWQLTLADFS
jgi:hypothetical protein